MPITQVASTMPYHNYIRPQVVVYALNYMIDEVNAGKTIFYDFYSPQAKSRDAFRENAGLLFFRGNPGAPFVVICPGVDTVLPSTQALLPKDGSTSLSGFEKNTSRNKLYKQKNKSVTNENFMRLCVIENFMLSLRLEQ